MPLFLWLNGAGVVGSLVIVGIVFGCVFLHELGHSLVAQANGIRVTDITLWPLGGMARMAEIPEDPKLEAKIAIAGPVVNLVIALVLLPFSSGFQAAASFGTSPIDTIVFINLMLGLFNLIPAFPMDGGRLLRAYFARKRSWLAATERAVAIGRQLALVAVIVTVASCITSIGTGAPVPWMLPIIAGFIWYTGTQELWATRRRHMERQGVGFGNLSDLFRQAFEGRPGAGPGRSEQEPLEVDFEPKRGPTRPGGPSRHGGFSEDYIRELERHRGPLHRPPADDQ